jgi:hypothetical protein
MRKLLFIAWLAMGQFAAAQGDTTPTKIQCDDSLWNYVYKSYRLHVLEKCKRATGTVKAVSVEDDGDAHLLMKLDSGQEHLLNHFNYERQKGYLVVEVICVYKFGGKHPKIECDGQVNKIYIPAIGERVEVIGTFVLDTKHSWNEIHPVTSIKILKN